MNDVSDIATIDIMDSLAWCRAHNAGIRFESDGTVTVWINGTRRRRGTFVLAVNAVRAVTGPS